MDYFKFPFNLQLENSVPGYFTLTPCQAGVYFVLLLSINKLIYCSYPLRACLIMSRRRIILLTLLIWITCLGVSSLSIYTTKREIIFDVDLYRCIYDRGTTSDARIVLISVFTLLPLSLILGLNVCTCSIAMSHNRTRGQRSIKAPLTVTSVSAVLLLTVGPFVVYCLITGVEGEHSDWKRLKLLSGYVYYINVFANPIIYTMTNTRFFNFVKFKLLPCFSDGQFNERVSSRFAMTRKSSSFYLKSRNFSVSHNKASTRSTTG